MNHKKIRNVKALKSIVTRLKARRKRVVFTNGCFDILHVGHIRYLRKAKRLGDILVVGLNTDRSVRQIKGERGRSYPRKAGRRFWRPWSSSITWFFLTSRIPLP